MTTMAFSLSQNTTEKRAEELLNMFLTDTEQEELRNAQERKKEAQQQMAEGVERGYTLQELQMLGDILKEAGEKAALYPHTL